MSATWPSAAWPITVPYAALTLSSRPPPSAAVTSPWTSHMPIDLEKAFSAQLSPVTSRWCADDVILYHLGLGAGLGGSVDPAELGYTYEGCLKVLPTFAVIPSSTAVPNMDLNSFPGI